MLRCVGYRHVPTIGKSARRFSSQKDALRQAFDAPNSYKPSSTASPTGLFRHRNLKHPDNFVPLVRRTVDISNSLLERFINPPTPYSQLSPKDAFLQGIKVIDRLSDCLCRVTDLAESVRTIHPDPRWVDAANIAYDTLVHHMNMLNTHKELYTTLDRLVSPVSDLPSENIQFSHALAAAKHFLHDFRKSGIHLPEESNKEFVRLSSDIISIGREFFNQEPYTVPIHIAKLAPFGFGFQHVIKEAALPGSTPKYFLLDARGWIAQLLARQHPDFDVREAIWRAANVTRQKDVDVLEKLLAARAQLARTVDVPTYAHYALSDKIAANPENVNTFLTSLLNANDPAAKNEVAELIERRNAVHSSTMRGGFSFGFASATLTPWDRDYLLTMPPPKDEENVQTTPQYFSVGTCMGALSTIFSHLFGISLQVEELLPGEGWTHGSTQHTSIVRLGVFEEGKGRIGTIYADLWDREGKNIGSAGTAAHYTIRCSRRVDDDNVSEEEIGAGWLGNEYQDEEHGVLINGEEGRWQTPIVVLTTNFERPARNSTTLLHMSEIETLFHEVGHALHSMLGRTPYQNCAGTRCATDFVEFPSILMEYLVQSPYLLSMFNRQDQDLPASASSIPPTPRYVALENASTITLASLDQSLHSLHYDQVFNSTQIAHDIQRSTGAGVIPITGTSPQAHFTHLFTYGATYYSYLLDRVLASRVYKNVFKDGAKEGLGREQGERLKNSVLRWGGGRDGWHCIAELLGGEDGELLKAGPTKAMETVGKWGLTGKTVERH